MDGLVKPDGFENGVWVVTVVNGATAASNRGANGVVTSLSHACDEIERVAVPGGKYYVFENGKFAFSRLPNQSQCQPMPVAPQATIPPTYVCNLTGQMISSERAEIVRSHPFIPNRVIVAGPAIKDLPPAFRDDPFLTLLLTVGPVDIGSLSRDVVILSRYNNHAALHQNFLKDIHRFPYDHVLLANQVVTAGPRQPGCNILHQWQWVADASNVKHDVWHVFNDNHYVETLCRSKPIESHFFIDGRYTNSFDGDRFYNHYTNCGTKQVDTLSQRYRLVTAPSYGGRKFYTVTDPTNNYTLTVSTGNETYNGRQYVGVSARNETLPTAGRYHGLQYVGLDDHNGLIKDANVETIEDRVVLRYVAGLLDRKITEFYRDDRVIAYKVTVHGRVIGTLLWWLETAINEFLPWPFGCPTITFQPPYEGDWLAKRVDSAIRQLVLSSGDTTVRYGRLTRGTEDAGILKAEQRSNHVVITHHADDNTKLFVIPNQQVDQLRPEDWPDIARGVLMSGDEWLLYLRVWPFQWTISKGGKWMGNLFTDGSKMTLALNGQQGRSIQVPPLAALSAMEIVTLVRIMLSTPNKS